ncbi:hypothetical protein [Sphingopyxis terrae]|uniref:hypothetical protein n=1 Tax=Sphingopyxis terrae TaxID=33052 RepID=UPI00364329CB
MPGRWPGALAHGKHGTQSVAGQGRVLDVGMGHQYDDRERLCGLGPGVAGMSSSQHSASSIGAPVVTRPR